MPPAPPQITVILPTYNWSGVLPFSIGSALGQSRSDFELLVVGDGCTDDSEAVVRSIGDARVRWINLPVNSGHQSQPNNEGLRQARGEFIAYLGHDDLWLPQHLALLTRPLEAGADVAYGVTALVGPEGDRVEPAALGRSYRPGQWLPPTGVAHRRRVTERVGGWRHHRELDVDPEIDLWRRAFEGGHPFQFVPRLTAVKFPAALRRDVYRLRPHHEQAAWLERMRREPDLEAELLATMLATARAPRMVDTEPYGARARDFLRETMAVLRQRGRQALRGVTGPRAGAGVEGRRRFKGLERSR